MGRPEMLSCVPKSCGVERDSRYAVCQVSRSRSIIWLVVLDLKHLCEYEQNVNICAP